MRYIFLDRDGVLNRKPPEGGYITAWPEFTWLPGAIEAVARLNRAGLTVLVVTNQRGIALGLYSEEDLAQTHHNMRADLARHDAHVDGVYYCPHDRGVCDCRKPGTGMFAQARKDFPEITGESSVMIGDSYSDIQAGQAAGMKTIFIRGEADRQKPGAATAEKDADAVADSLLEAVERYLDLPGNI
jgi:D-glycero-D-manno-heptose 1,7-bisphosphate phosphatase